MNSPTSLFFYALYAAPFFVAALVLACNQLLLWYAAKQDEKIEKPIMTPEDPMVEEVRSKPMPRHYMSYATNY